MKLTAYLTIEGFERGKWVSTTTPANSLVLNFINILNIQMSQTARTITDVADASASRGTNTANFDCVGPVNASNFGVMVGTGSTAVAVTDTKLVTKVAHGTGATQVTYAVTAVSAPSTSGSDRLFTIARTFTGNATSAVNVTEVGLYCRVGGNYYYCIDRTLNSFTIGTGAEKTVTYTIKVTV